MEKGGTYVVPAQDSHDFSAAVELHEETLVEVLEIVSAGDRTVEDLGGEGGVNGILS